MKTLYLIRHAKSSWDDVSLSDFERPLNKRGEKNAPQMGRILAQAGMRPDRIVSSPAARAIRTARLIAQEVGYAAEDIDADPRIYEADLQTLVQIICELDDRFDIVALVGHNPGLSWLASHLTGERFSDMPTCAVVHVELVADRWRDADAGRGQQQAFLYPRLYGAD